MSHTITKKISDQQIDDIMCTALEGGITYWCDAAVTNEKRPVGMEWAHEALTNGLSIKLHDAEDDKWYTLTLKKFLTGLALKPKLDLDYYDAGDADEIVQLAIFGEVVYG